MENEKLTLAPEKAEALKKHCLDILNEKHFVLVQHLCNIKY